MKISELVSKLDYHFNTLAGEAVTDPEKARALRNTEVSAIVNNSNLGAETAPEDVLGSLSYAEDVSALSGLPIKMTTVSESLYPELSGRIPDLFPLELQRRPTE